jgi:hypothetical protein
MKTLLSYSKETTIDDGERKGGYPLGDFGGREEAVSPAGFPASKRRRSATFSTAARMVARFGDAVAGARRVRFFTRLSLALGKEIVKGRMSRFGFATTRFYVSRYIASNRP